jgi:gliding motility-associated-like protein
MNSLGCSGTVVLPLNLSDITTSSYLPNGGNYLVNNPISFTNQSTGGISWNWNFGDGNISNAENPVYTFAQPGIYSVTLITTGVNGCTDTIAYTFEINDDVTVNPAGTIAIPSAFTPDNDGNNDMLFVRGGPFTQMDFRVYNEWGNLLFHSTNQSSGWDGTFKGERQPVGTYVWTLVGKTSTNKEIKMKGDVTILK